MKAYIKAIDYYLPHRVVTNEELVKEFPEWTVEKIAQKVGILSRHVSAEDETISDMAANAAEKLFQSNPSINRDSVDFVILCTQSPDYFLPSTACIVQKRLGLSEKCGAFDFNLGCSGYVYGLAIAKGLIVAGIASNVLLITSEAYTKHIHKRDKGNRTLFGDAATATVISNNGFAEIGDFVLGTDGGGAKDLIVKSGGMVHKSPSNDLTFDENGNPKSSDHLYMDGAEIFNFTLREVPKLVTELLARNSLCLTDIEMFVFHQANTFILNHLRKKMKVPVEKFYINMSHLGNTVSSTIPIALCQSYQDCRLSGKVMICGFGVGLSWGGCILNCNTGK